MRKKNIYAAALAAIMAASSCSSPDTAPAVTDSGAAVTAATTASSEVKTADEAETVTEAAVPEETTTVKTTITTAETTTAETTTTAAETTATAEEVTTEAVTEEAQTSATTKKPGLFDNIGVTTTLAQNEGIDSSGNKYVDVVFDELPTSYDEFIALPQASLTTVYDTAAMTVLALCFYPSDPELSIKMYEYVSGPRTINNTEYSFIKDRFMDYDYVPRSYFTGATPANDYKPSEPYTVRVSENPYTYENDGYAKMFLTSGGADTERFVMLRKGKDDKWYLWEQFILVGIREPKSNSPWA